MLAVGWILASVVASLVGVALLAWLALYVTSRVTWRRVVTRTNASQQTPGEFDVAAYTGTWHEIARYPQRFQTGCRNVTATYTQEAPDRIKVVNRCDVRRADGTTRTNVANGFARPTPTPGVLGVSFFPKQRWLPAIYGSYTVVKLDRPADPAHGLSIVSNPDKTALWVLSRTPRLSPTKWRETRTWLASNGYDSPLIVN
jgi:apolipoprotein D and lipocalin family protein